MASVSDIGAGLCTRPRTCMANASTAPLLVYHPQGGLGNVLFGLASSTLLATVLCRRLGIAWGRNTNVQALASFAELFQVPAGVEFLNETEGKAQIVALDGGKIARNCTAHMGKTWTEGGGRLASLMHPREFTFAGPGGGAYCSLAVSSAPRAQQHVLCACPPQERCCQSCSAVAAYARARLHRNHDCRLSRKHR